MGWAHSAHPAVRVCAAAAASFEASESDAKEAAVLVLQPMKMHFRVTSE